MASAVNKSQIQLLDSKSDQQKNMEKALKMVATPFDLILSVKLHGDFDILWQKIGKLDI